MHPEDFFNEDFAASLRQTIAAWVTGIAITVFIIAAIVDYVIGKML